MFKWLWETLVRWRTWVANSFFAVLITPDLILALLGFDWGLIIPREFMPYVTLLVIVLNVWMRPRPAVIKEDPEANLRLDRIRKGR